MSEIIEKAIDWALSIANDSGHGYDQTSRWGPDYDCSSLVISAYQQAGVGVKTAGATYTGNMRSAFQRCGFANVTSTVDVYTGKGLVRGDVLLNQVHHTALYLGDGQLVQASINENGKVTGGKVGDQTGKEIWTRSYYNYPWDCVLRYGGADTTQSYTVGAGTTNAATTSNYTVEVAPLQDKAYKAGTRRYVANCDVLNMRCGPSTDRSVLQTLIRSQELMWYGYYAGSGDDKWVLIRTLDGVTGWVCAMYLRK